MTVSCSFSFSWYSHCVMSVMYYYASTGSVWLLKVVKWLILFIFKNPCSLNRSAVSYGFSCWDLISSLYDFLTTEDIAKSSLSNASSFVEIIGEQDSWKNYKASGIVCLINISVTPFCLCCCRALKHKEAIETKSQWEMLSTNYILWITSYDASSTNCRLDAMNQCCALNKNTKIISLCFSL